MGNRLFNLRHRRRRRNLPAELKVEIVDCFPVENAVHFLANVPNRLIIHHCAPRVRRMLKMISQIARDYARTLTAPNSRGHIWLQNGHKYTPEMDIFLRYGAAHCRAFIISRGTRAGFVGYPANFFDDLIKHYYETKVPKKAVRYLDIELALENPAPWPAVHIQTQAGKMKSEELEVWESVEYLMRNKNNRGIAWMLFIHFQGDATCYKQMTQFEVYI